VSAFTQAFAAGVRDVMRKYGVQQVPLAERIGRSQGFISERTSGKRAVDTDILDGIAAMAGVTPRALVREILELVPDTVYLTTRASRSVDPETRRRAGSPRSPLD
jgi:transcriptional regulator with XRE-family HTH domain